MALETKKPKNRYSLNFSNDPEYLKEFCMQQSNLTDTIRYLIEEEIKKNGMRNLQEYIPAVRPKLEIDKGYSDENSTENESIELIESEKKQPEIKAEKVIPDCYKD